MLIQIKAPHFTAGVVLEENIVTVAAPIIKYMLSWSRDQVHGYCRQKDWIVIDFPDIPPFLDRRAGAPVTATFVQPLILTYTILNTYDICPHQMFRRYIKKDLKFIETPEMKFGNEVHAAFEYRMGGKPLPHNMVHWEPIASAIADRKPRTEQQLAIDANGKPAEYWGKGTAAPFFRGKNDLTLLNGTKALLIDIKTGKKREEPFELETNAMLVHAHNPHLTEIKGSYLWLKEGVIGQTHHLTDTKSTWAKVNNKAEEIRDCQATNQWPKKKGPLCNWCNVFDCDNNGNPKEKTLSHL